MKTIKPQILKGTRDFLPIDMAKRNLVMQQIRAIFARFGYDQIETPILNRAENILGKYGEEGSKLTYNFEDNGGRNIALPYDLTVPFARLVAANWQKLPIPFKRYQIQRVWRAEKPQKGRLREFYQCDIDVVGTRSLIAEAEVAKVMVTVFNELGFKDFTIKFNSRRLLNSVLEKMGVPQEKTTSTIQIIDKLAKIGPQKVISMLKAIGVKNGQEILETSQPENLKDFDLSEINQFLEYCKALKVPEQYLEFDPSLARGLDYYTGLSFEVYDKNCDFGALCAGGRYDNLCRLFCNEDFSGVGVAFGFDRIVLALEEMGKLENVRQNSQALVTIFDEASAVQALNLYQSLTADQVNCEIYFEPTKLSKQFKYADKKGIPFVLIQGPEELAADQVTVKNMKTGKQKSIATAQLSSYLKNYYEN